MSYIAAGIGNTKNGLENDQLLICALIIYSTACMICYNPLYVLFRIKELDSQRLLSLGAMPSKPHTKPDVDIEDHHQQHRT